MVFPELLNDDAILFYFVFSITRYSLCLFKLKKRSREGQWRSKIAGHGLNVNRVSIAEKKVQ